MENKNIQGQPQVDLFRLVESISTLSVSLNQLQTRVANLAGNVDQLYVQTQKIDSGAGNAIKSLQDRVNALSEDATKVTPISKKVLKKGLKSENPEPPKAA